MTNKEVVSVLEEIAVLLDLSGESPFKSRAYTNAARQIEQLDEDLTDLVAQGRLREMKGIGDALEEKLSELVQSGRLGYHETLRSKFPQSLFELFAIPNLGPKRIKQVYEELGIQSLAELEAACHDGRLSQLKGFGPKMQEKLLEGISFRKRHAGVQLFDRAFQEGMRLKQILASLPEAKHVELAGSLRRRKETVKDIDLIASSTHPNEVMEAFVTDAEVATITGRGDTKASVVLKSGIAADLRVVSPAQYPYALVHFTGSKEHNVVLRQRAKDRGWKLNEYGLFDGEKLLRCKDEAALYKKLGLPWIPPEMREDMGEFEVKSVPELVTIDHVFGMVHCHSTYSDGRDSIANMVTAAKDRGYTYITITDHSQSAAYAGGLTPDRLRQQHSEIDRLNKSAGIRILKGIESDIRADGSLDYEDRILDTFEVIIASVHSGLAMTEDEATRRIVRAVEEPHTNILGHPSARLLLQRQGYPLDWDVVFRACAENQVAIEINANCRRLDLDWRLVRRAKENGCRFSVGPDAHRVESLDDMEYGLGIARKGWLEPHDVINCLDAGAFLAFCRKEEE